MKEPGETIEGTRRDQRRDFWMCETRTGQQVANLRVSYTMMMMMMMLNIDFRLQARCSCGVPSSQMSNRVTSQNSEGLNRDQR